MHQIDASFTASIAKETENFNLVKLNKKLINKLYENKNHGVKRGKKRKKITDNNNKKKVPGIHSPFVYLGSAGSCFSVHLEDANSSSINVQLAGCPKIWLFIKKASVATFEKTANSLLSNQLDSDPRCKNPLRHKYLIINEDYLIEHKIQYCKVVQEPGMVVITHPNGYHAGYNTGWNVNEAVNFIVPCGIDYTLNSQPCGCNNNLVNLTFPNSFVQRHRPNALNKENQLVVGDPDDPQVIKRKKEENDKRLEKARTALSEKRNMKRKPDQSDEWLRLYFTFLMDKSNPRLSLTVRQIPNFKTYLVKNGISSDDETMKLDPTKFAKLTDDIVRRLKSIKERSYFQLPEQKEIIDFIKEKQLRSVGYKIFNIFLFQILMYIYGYYYFIIAVDSPLNVTKGFPADDAFQYTI